MTDLLLLIGTYLTGGLFTARGVKFRLEDAIDNAPATATWWKKHVGHTIISDHRFCYTCSSEAPRAHLSPLGYITRWNVVPYSTVAGIGWPVLIPGYLTYKGGAAIAHGVAPAVHWFFENPRRRKARRTSK